MFFREEPGSAIDLSQIVTAQDGHRYGRTIELRLLDEQHDAHYAKQYCPDDTKYRGSAANGQQCKHEQYEYGRTHYLDANRNLASICSCFRQLHRHEKAKRNRIEQQPIGQESDHRLTPRK